MFFEELEQIILAQYPQKIRLQGLLKKRKETPKEFLWKFLTKWNKEKNTIFVVNHVVDTDTGRRRSIGDIFMILRYYYPEVTLREVIQWLYVDWITLGDENYRSSYCYTIHKRVWYNEEDSGKSSIINKESSDEYGIVYQKYIDALNDNIKDNYDGVVEDNDDDW